MILVTAIQYSEGQPPQSTAEVKLVAIRHLHRRNQVKKHYQT